MRFARCSNSGRIGGDLPVVESVRPLIEKELKRWPFRPVLLTGEDDKFRAFKLADVALAASGTVTLELALAGTPMIVAYMVDRVMLMFRSLLKVPSIVLANLVLGEKAFRSFCKSAARESLWEQHSRSRRSEECGTSKAARGARTHPWQDGYRRQGPERSCRRDRHELCPW